MTIGRAQCTLCNMLDRNAPPPVDLPDFARSIHDAAADSSATRWGRKVMLSTIVDERDLPTVKALLLAARRAGLIQLARIDHCPAEYRAARQASEIDAGGAIYDSVIDVSVVNPWEVRS